MALYHPIASIIVNSYKSISYHLTRDVGELKKLQSSHSKSEEFTFKSLTTICNKVSGTLLSNIKGCNVVFNIFDSNLVHKIQSTNREDAMYRLIFTPIDSAVNYSRGLANFASSFVLQQKLENGEYKNIFCLIFTQYDGLDFIMYTQNNENNLNWIYINEKMVKPSFKTSFAICNLGFSRFIASEYTQSHEQKDALLKVASSCLNFSVNHSNCYNAALVCNNILDGLFLLNQHPINVLPCYMILKNLGFSTNLNDSDFVNILDSKQNVDFIALSQQCFAKVGF